MAAEKSTFKHQIKSFAGESMYIWNGFDSQRHLSDTEIKYDILFCFLDRAFSIWKTKINQQNAQINSGLIYY